MGIEIGNALVARCGWDDFGPDEGYLMLRQGMRLIVEYVGQGPDEAGWLFGYERNVSDGEHGWFPEECVEKFAPPAPVAKALPTPESARPPPPARSLSAVEQPPPAAQPPIAAATPSAPLPPPATPLSAMAASQKSVPSVPAPPSSRPLEAMESPSPAPARPPPVATPLAAVAASLPPPPPPPAIDLRKLVCPGPPPGPPPAPLPPPQGAPPQAAALSSDDPVEAEDEDDASQPPLSLPGFDSGEMRPSVAEQVARGEADGEELPLARLRGELLRQVLRKRVIVIDAATGSGKSTMVPLYLCGQCAELGRPCRIVVTQPRRLAAKGLANRVAKQCGSPVGDVAGYRVGGDRVDRGSSIIYVTAGHLLEALVHNPSHLSTYSHVVLDEVHERSVEADFLMALLRLSLSRPETMGMRIIVMSATLQKTLGDFFRPILLPCPENARPGKLSLPSGTPYKVTEYNWEDMKAKWPEVVGRMKEPDFTEFKYSKSKNVPARRRSDQLTRLCKELAPFCARLLCHLRRERLCRVALVFLPGLDQMREVEDKLQEELRSLPSYAYGSCETFLMHSALEEEVYRGALDPLRDDDSGWRVVLATNIAESSLTVPGVDVVVDFCLHRVNVYDDEIRMSMLATEWYSKASAQQRRGRTGRTNDGIYIQLIGPVILNELKNFDESCVERSALTRVTLEAAHLAELFNNRPAVRSGLPVDVHAGPDGGFTETRIADYWHGPGEGWRMRASGWSREDCTTAHPESALKPLTVDAWRMLSLLPAPPKEDRVHAALGELQELGAMTSDNTPSVLGTAYLKLPIDIPLGRLVIMAWALGYPADGAVLAAALSLTPACDVMRTPFNTKHELDTKELRLFRKVVDARRHFDKRSFSEPIGVLNLFRDWIENNASYSIGCKSGTLGRMPVNTWWRDLVNQRLWTQFTEKAIDIVDSLLRLSPPDMSEKDQLPKLLQCMRGSASLTNHDIRALTSTPTRHLHSLLTWALSPCGFLGVGQTPALYNEGGSYTDFKQAVRRNNFSRSDRAGSMYWPKIKPEDAKAIMLTALELRPGWVWAPSSDQTYLGFPNASDGCMPPDCEFLARICGPFNGRETLLNTKFRTKVPRPPRHPCILNWYMPRRDGQGISEVRVGWKSQVETLLHLPKPSDMQVACRPKRFMVATGAEYHSNAGRRAIFLRGTTVLPDEDGGRSALLWLLAAGVPREAEFVAMAAPCQNKVLGDFEVRALRMWRRTFWLPRDDPLTAADLREVNRFRSGLLELQRRRPHRIAGLWCLATASGRFERQIECVDEVCERDASDEKQECFLVTGGPKTLCMRGKPGGQHWHVFEAEHDDAIAAVEPNGQTCTEVDDSLHWSDGTTWVRQWQGEQPLLSSLGVSAVRNFRQAGIDLNNITSDERGEAPHCGRRWLPRLVPFVATQTNANSRSPFLAPLDLDAVEEYISDFARRLTKDDVVSDDDQDGDASDEDEVRVVSDDDDDEDENEIDTTQEGIDDGFLWRLARQRDWNPAQSRDLLFVETSLALPKTAMCVDCEQDNKAFSKSQLAKHPDERRCKDCVNRSANQAYRPSNVFGPQGARSAATVAASLHDGSLPENLAPSLSASAGVAICSSCKLQLTKANCSASQRQKAPSKRRCNRCMGQTVATR